MNDNKSDRIHQNLGLSVRIKSRFLNVFLNFLGLRFHCIIIVLKKFMISSPALLLRFIRMVLDQLQLVLVRLRVVVGVFGW